MTQSATHSTEAKSPLDAAQKIVAVLLDLTKDDQSLALQFAMQTLRVANPSPPSAAAETQVQMNSPLMSASHGGGVQTVDIKSFTAAKSPQSDQQFTAVVAYYYQFEAKAAERKDTIDAETMKEAARLAGRPQVARWAMTLTNAKNAGYLNATGDGKYSLSSVGENLVAITLPGNVRSGTTGSGKGKKPKATGKKATAKKATKKQN